MNDKVKCLVHSKISVISFSKLEPKPKIIWVLLVEYLTMEKLIHIITDIIPQRIGTYSNIKNLSFSE